MPTLLNPPTVPDLPPTVKAAQVWRAYRNGPTATDSEDEFLKAHLPLVRSVVERMKVSLPPHIDSEELYSVGVLGLVLASRAFRPDQGSSFTTYATTRIRGAVLDELRRMDWMPRRARARAKQLRDTINALEQQLGRAATESEVAGALSLSAEEYAELLDQVRPISCLELDAAASDEDSDESSMHELVADFRQETASTQLERKELVSLMAARINQMPEVQRKVLAFYYHEELRLAEIAVIFGVTESRICQIHAQAITSLRTYLKSAMNS